MEISFIRAGLLGPAIFLAPPGFNTAPVPLVEHIECQLCFRIVAAARGNGVAGDLKADHSGGIVALRIGASQIESVNILTNWTATLKAPRRIFSLGRAFRLAEPLDHCGVAVRIRAEQIESVDAMTNWTATWKAPAND